MSKAFNRLQSRIVTFHVSEPYGSTEETRARYILSFVCREMQRRFHSALESLFMAPAALPIQEVISASMEPSAEMIEPRLFSYIQLITHFRTHKSIPLIVIPRGYDFRSRDFVWYGKLKCTEII